MAGEYFSGTAGILLKYLKWEGPNYQPNATTGNTWDYTNGCDCMFVVSVICFVYIQVVFNTSATPKSQSKFMPTSGSSASTATASFLLQSQQEKLPWAALQGPPPRVIEFPRLLSPGSVCWHCQTRLRSSRRALSSAAPRAAAQGQPGPSPARNVLSNREPNQDNQRTAGELLGRLGMNNLATIDFSSV